MAARVTLHVRSLARSDHQNSAIKYWGMEGRGVELDPRSSHVLRQSRGRRLSDQARRPQRRGERQREIEEMKGGLERWK